MPDIPYINPGAELDAATWNPLFAEADRKLTAILANHSLLWWNDASGFAGAGTDGLTRFWQDGQTQIAPEIISNIGFCGMCFWFGRNAMTDLIFGPFDDYRIYDHRVFTDYVANNVLPPAESDDTVKVLRAKQFATGADYIAELRKIIGPTRGTPSGTNFFVQTVFGAISNPSILDFSLQAHTVDYTPGDNEPVPYKILDGGQYPCEHVRTYDAVELIFTTDFSFPDLWNKYNFFRLHNFSNAPITITFVGFVVTVPAFGSQCVRRTATGGTYTLGYNHFWQMLPGDPRVWFPTKTPWIRTTMTNVTHNNVINPNVVSLIFGKMRGNVGLGDNPYVGGIVTEMDWAKAWDMSGLYCGDGKPFPTPTPDTPVGDMVTQRGTILSVKTPVNDVSYRYPIQFKSWNTIQSDFAAGGIIVERGDYFQYRLSSDLPGSGAYHDIIDGTTNFTALINFSDLAPARAILNGTVGGALFINPYSDNNQRLQWTPVLNYASDSQSITFAPGPFANFGYEIPQVTPISTYQSQIVQTSISTVTASYRFTPFGMVYWWDISITLQAEPEDDHAFDSLNGVIWRAKDNVLTGRATGWIPSSFPQPTLELPLGPAGDIAVQSFRSPANIGYLRPPGNITTIPSLDFGTYGFRWYPDWRYLTEKTDLTESEVAGLTASVELPQCNVCRRYSEVNQYHITSAYVAKTSITLAQGHDFTKEQDGDGPLPPGYNATWRGIRATVLSNDGSWDFQDDTGGAIPGQIVFERMPMLVEHYNGIASYVNCISRYVPLNASNIWFQLIAPQRESAGLVLYEYLAPLPYTTPPTPAQVIVAGSYSVWPGSAFFTTDPTNGGRARFSYADLMAFFALWGIRTRTDIPAYDGSHIDAGDGNYFFTAPTPGFVWVDNATLGQMTAHWGLGISYSELVTSCVAALDPSNPSYPSNFFTFSIADAWEHTPPDNTITGNNLGGHEGGVKFIGAAITAGSAVIWGKAYGSGVITDVGHVEFGDLIVHGEPIVFITTRFGLGVVAVYPDFSVAF